MIAFWTEADESRLNQLRRECQALLTRRSAAAPDAGVANPEATSAALYRSRRLRDRCFPQPELLFGEPAWDMLLDLHSAHEGGRIVSTTSACLAGGGPSTTARRWLELLERMALVERQANPHDRRAQIVSPTSQTLACMAEYLHRLAR
jgi:hypothetical protein